MIYHFILEDRADNPEFWNRAAGSIYLYSDPIGKLRRVSGHIDGRVPRSLVAGNERCGSLNH